MANNTNKAKLPWRIRGALFGLRWRIRTYVWIEGLSVAIVWLCLTFWAGMAIDYLPVLLGSNEMPRAARLLLLVVIAAVLAVILFRWILRRAFVPLANRSLAVLLERRHQQFHDSLITAVELTGRADRAADHDPTMLADTEEDALQTLGRVRLSSVFDARPLVFSFFGAIVLAATIGGAYAADRHFNDQSLMKLGFERLYLLQDHPWPRNSRIEVVGIQVKRDEEVQTAEGSSSLVEFNERHVKVARGASVSLSVRADAGAKFVPEMCVVHYSTSEGDRGRVNMIRVGQIRDGFQYYRYDGKPFKGIVSSVRFDVVGFDHRERGYEIEVVESPLVVNAELDCVFPDYMVNEELSSWLPRTIPLTTSTQLPRGTKFTLRGEANKPLQQVFLHNSDTDESTTIEPEGTAFEIDIKSLGETLSLEVSLQDADNVMSDRPYRIYVVGVADEAPGVNVRLRGIGGAITPDARVPVRGKIQDDYGLAKAWFDLSVNDGDPKEVELATAGDGSVDASVDFRDQRGTDEGIKLQPGDKLRLTVKATDQYNLGEAPNTGVGDHYQLDVVTPDQLLSLLEARELGLRKRFEQIQNELTEMRDSLVRVRAEGPVSAAGGDEPEDGKPKEAAAATDEPAGGEEPSDTDEAKDALTRVWSLRLLRSQRAKLQSQKSAQETLGVSASFDDIREELVNNRVDSEDRKERLQTQIIEPLKAIGSAMFPALDEKLDELAQRLEDRSRETVDAAEEDEEVVSRADAALAETDKILLAIDAVLEKMLHIEDFNDMLDDCRDLISELEGLLDDTKKAQKQQILDLLK